MTITEATIQTATTPQRATAFTAFWLYQAAPDRPVMADGEREGVAQSMLEAIARSGDSVEVRAAYSTTGLSAGVDLILWLVADDCAPIQRLASEIHGSPAGRALTLRHVYLGVASMSQ